MTDLRTIGINGSPSPASRSRTLAALAVDLLGGGPIVDLALLDAGALLGRSSDRHVDDAVAELAVADVIVLATPTYRATYTALTKTIFDLVPRDSLRGSITVPIATGGGTDHALVIDHALRPLVASLGGWVTPSAVFGAQRDFDDDGRPLARLVDQVETAVAEAHDWVLRRGAHLVPQELVS